MEISSPVLCAAKQDEGGKSGRGSPVRTVMRLGKKFSPYRIVK